MLTVTNLEKHDWASMPLDEMAFGNAMDCDFTLRAWNILSGDIKKLGLYPVYHLLLKDIAVILGEVENTGIKIDDKYLKVLEEKLVERIATNEKELEELSPLDGKVNPNSIVDLGKVLFSNEGFGLVATEFSKKTKKPSITEEHLKTIRKNITDKKSIKFIDSLLRYKTQTKQYRTYVKGVEAALKWNEDGRIYSSYNFASTVTGRLSCSLYSAGPSQRKGVSFHTLPRPTSDDVNIRKLMIADEDKVFITADFSTAELRVLAQCSKDKKLIHAFNTGQDLHKYTASLIYGKPVSDISKKERQIAKSVSFLIVYGGGPKKLSQQIGTSIGYAQGIFDAYQTSFPKVFQWIEFVNGFIEQNGYATSLFGRRRNLPNVNSPIRKYKYRAFRQGMNFIIQSSASDIMLHAIKRFSNNIQDSKLQAQILATVHDSVEVQCSLDDVDRVVHYLKEDLTSIEDFKTNYNLNFTVPFEVDIEIGNSFGDGIPAELDDNGFLVNKIEILKHVQNS